MTPATFRTKVKELLGETQRQSGSAPAWTDPQLDSWRDSELSTLYAKGLFKVDSTRTLAGWTETTIPTYTTGVRQRYYSMPAAMRRVLRIEIIDPTDDGVVMETTRFDSHETTGYVRLDIGANYSTNKIRLIGEFEYTTIDECPAEVADVMAFGVVIRALVGEYIQRQRSKRARTSTRITDVAPGAIAAGLAVINFQYKQRLADALSIQDLRVYR